MCDLEGGYGNGILWKTLVFGIIHRYVEGDLVSRTE